MLAFFRARHALIANQNSNSSKAYAPSTQSSRNWQVGAMSNLELTILMPCLNEAETLQSCIEKAQTWIAANSVSAEIVIADNGSTDGSQELARKLGARVVNVKVRGYGAALYYGTQEASGRYIIMGDADDSYDFSNLSGFLEKLRAGYDLVMGNRFKGGIMPGAMPWQNRYIGNPVLTTIGRVLFRSPLGDFHCGLRGYSAEAFQRMKLRTLGMEFASEMVLKATLSGMRIAEVPTVLHPDGRSRPPHLRRWRDGWRHLRFMLIYSPNWLFLYPGMITMVLGLLTVIALLPGPLQIAGRHFDVHTMAYAATAVLVGFKAVVLAFLSSVFAMRSGLIPRRVFANFLFDIFKLEIGLVLGIVLIFSGVVGALSSLWMWSEQSFGPLVPSETMRIVIPSILTMTLGFEIVLVSFYVSLLQLRFRD